MERCTATAGERTAALPGDDLVDADVVMDRGFDLAAPPTVVWPWLVHLGPTATHGTRVHLRLRLGPVRRRRLAEVGGGFVDAVTVAGLAAALRERVANGMLP